MHGPPLSRLELAGYLQHEIDRAVEIFGTGVGALERVCARHNIPTHKAEALLAKCAPLDAEWTCPNAPPLGW